MRLLVPLPFDISNQAHGRNLRIAHLLQAMHASCEVLCLTPDERTAIGARDVMPGVMVQSVGSIRASSTADRILQNEPYLVRRSLSFLGCDAAFARAVQRLVPST